MSAVERPKPVTVDQPVTITVDGRAITAQNGDLLIDACERAGTYIPRFCYHPRMSPVGMCRMCLVEVDTGRGPALQPSCMLPTTDGMVVDTQSDRVRKAQDGVLEFLLINHPLDCPVCDKGGECPLQDTTVAYGPGESRWVEEKRHYPKPIPISATVQLDRERCILCDRCTRFADEVAGDALIHFMDRGSATQVNTFPGEPFASYFSGNTVQICPVGALTATPYRFKARPWDLEQRESTCTTCSLGCRITVHTSRNQVLRYQGVDSDPVNWGWLCDKGRFGFEAVGHADRLAAPLVRQGTELGEARWGDALAAAAGHIRSGLDRSGASGVAVIGGARLTNESAYAWAKLAKGIIGTDHVDAQLGDGLPADFVLGTPRATIDDVCRPGGTVVWMAPDPREELPVLYLRLRHAVLHDGVTLIEVTPHPTSLTGLARVSLHPRPGEAAALAAALVAGEPAEAAGVGAEAIREAAVALRDARDGVRVAVGRASMSESAGPTVDAAATLIAGLEGATVLPVLRRANVVGALDAGLAPGLLPGRVRRADAAATWSEVWGSVPDADGLDTAGILRAAADGRIDTLILLGADPIEDFPDRALAERALAGARTIIAVDQFLNASNRQADVVLAAAGFAEVAGTTTNVEGRVTLLTQAVTPPGTARADWQIAAELARRLGGDLGVETFEGLWNEMVSRAPSHAGLTSDVVADPGHADGCLVADPGTAPPAILRFEPPMPTEVPPLDSYSLRLVASRALYDDGVLLAHSPSSAALARPSVLRLSPADFDRVGSATGKAKVLTAGATAVFDVVSDPGVPTGTAVATWGVAGADLGRLIDSSTVVTEIRLEVAT